MQLDAYRAFTRALTESLEADGRVLGLVAVGSMAERDYGPDEWSDHDFFVVTATGEQEGLRSDLAWLPNADGIAFAYRETEHGLKVVYADGHLLEFAVFDLEEIGLAGVNRYRVLLDRGGVAERLAEVARATAARPRPAAGFLFDQLVTRVLVGVGRYRRGEALSGVAFVHGLAVRDLVTLLARAIPSERAGLLDDLDPFRRFDLVHPEFAGEIDELLRADAATAGLGLLALAERELRPRLPGLRWEALEIVRNRLQGDPAR